MSKLNSKNQILKILAEPVLKIIIKFVWMSCRVSVQGEENIRQVFETGKPFIPCYWHQQHVFCAWYLLKLQKKGLKLGFLISPSRDGDVPAKIIQSWGAQAIRGSSNRTGARAIRDLYQIVVKQGVSPVNTSDGPTGPIYKFKPGAIMLAQITQSPILPMAYSAKRFWELGSWDRFWIPKPFTRVVITIGEPRYVNKAVSIEAQSEIATEMEQQLMALQEQAASSLN